MAVERDDVGLMLDFYDDGAARVSPGEDDLPARDCMDRAADGCGDVEAVVEVRVVLALVGQGRLELLVGGTKALSDLAVEWPDEIDRHGVAIRPGHYLVRVCRSEERRVGK